jgi:hypothetical protein
VGNGGSSRSDGGSGAGVEPERLDIVDWHWIVKMIAIKIIVAMAVTKLGHE